MFFVTNLCLCVFSVVLLSATKLTSRRSDEKNSLHHKIYSIFVYSTIFLLIADLLSRFDGRTEPIFYMLNSTGNFLLFLLNPVLPSFWFLYVHNHVFCDDKKTLRLGRPFIIFGLLNIILTILSQFTGWYYYIDTSNIYHRGILFFIPAAFDQVIMVAAFVMLIANRRRIERKYYFALLFFAIPPSVCLILQTFIYGIAFALNGIAMSLVIMFMNTQNRRMNIDYLTGIFNRKQLDYYIADKIRACSDSKSFSAIFLDLDNFKYINDSLGHNVGDEALKAVVTLLKRCIRSTDFIARFGGDEFFIVMDITDEKAICDVVERIDKCVEAFNAEGPNSYKLSLSMGYLIYDVEKRLSVEEFEYQIDKLMYCNKLANKTAAY